MSLHEEPRITIQRIKDMNASEGEREVKNLLAEISSGIYTFEQLGIENEEDLWRLIKKNN